MQLYGHTMQLNSQNRQDGRQKRSAQADTAIEYC